MNFSHYLALHSLQLHMHNLIMMAALITAVPRALQTSVCGTIKISPNTRRFQTYNSLHILRKYLPIDFNALCWKFWLMQLCRVFSDPVTNNENALK